MDNIQIDIALVAKYLAGEVAPEEAMAIEVWLKDPDNKKQFEEIREVWTMLPKTKVYKSPDLADGWLQIQNSLSQKTSSKKNKILPRLYAAAAIAIGIIFCGILFYSVLHNHPESVKQKLITRSASTDLLKDTLPDGSIVILNRNSSIQYQESFNKTSRKLSLNGEAYFNIVPDKRNPFIITEDGLNIKVAGTSFNVNKRENPRSIEVQVRSGTVKMYTSKNEITVSKSQTGIYDNANNLFTVKDSVDENSMSYATGDFSFINLSLAQISAYLQKAFGVTILIKKDNLLQCRMTARFKNKSLDYIMNVISITLNIQYTIDNNKINIDGEGCN